MEITKQEILKELKKLRDCKNYTNSIEINVGYREGILDAIDLVEKITKISEQTENQDASKGKPQRNKV